MEGDAKLPPPTTENNNNNNNNIIIEYTFSKTVSRSDNNCFGD